MGALSRHERDARSRIAASVGALLVTVIVTAGCAGGSHASSSATGSTERVETTTSTTVPETASPSSTASTTSTTVAKSDLEVAEAVVVDAAVSAPWTQCCAPEVFGPTELETHVCGTTESLPAATAGFERQFALGLDAAGTESAHLIIAAKVEPTASVATSELAAVGASGYQPCMMNDINSALLTTFGQDAANPSTTVTRLGPSALGTGIHDRYVSRMAAGGQTEVVYNDIVRVQVGRAILRFGLTSYGTAAPASVLDIVVRATAIRAREAQSSV